MDTCNILKRSFLLLALVIGGFDSPVWAGGPRLVSDTGEPYGWDPSQPVLFNADQGPLGVLDNATVLDLVQQAFEVWKSVPTATITFANGGSLPLDVDTPEELFMSIDQRDSLSPIIFDTDGSLTDAVFGPGSSTSILGFAGAEFVTLEAPFFITEGRAIFNGRAINGDFDDGIEISTERLLGLFVHEFGHFIGLGHTQVNGFSTTSYGGPLPTSMTATMFPFLLGGEATLHTDDVVAVSTLYPTSTFFSSTGAIIGDILLPDRITPFTGANVISRNIDNPHADAVSYVSGARFISRVFKTTTLTELQGRFQLFGLTPGASYTVEVEQIDPAFTGRSLVGSVDPPPVLPGPPEFWDAAESAMDDPAASTPIVVTAGSPVTGVDIILNAYGFGLRLKTDYDVGYRPFSVFSTDLDGDGDNDLAVANYGSRNVSVLLNNGDGTFADKVDYDVGYRPFSVFSTDLDGDGDNDLAVANNGNRNVSVLLNNGDGTFADKVDYDVGYGPYSVFSADVDGDGDNDLAVANNGSRNVSVLLNNGDGTFADKVDYDVGYRPGSVFSADVDGDGDNDLITANWFSDNVSVLLNNGDGTFADKVDYDVGYGPYSVFSADVDGDGDNDLITANWFSGNVSVLLNNGNGTFAGKMDYVAGTNPFSVFSADLDGDGDNDLAVANSGSDNVSVLLNNGNGTFADKVDYGVWDGPASVFIADLDGDGDNDLAVANYGSDNVSVLLHFSRPYPPIVTSTDPDSGVELVLTPVKITGSNFQRGATVTFGDSRAINVVVVATNTITAKTPAHPAGTVDMIVTNPDGMTGTLSGGFTFLSHPVVTSVNPASGPELGGTPVTIAGGNFKIGTTVTFSDIAATDIVVFTSIITAVTPTHPAGTVDVIVTNPDGQADTLENGFTFVPALFGLPTDYTVGNEPFSVFTADLDGDGDNDLAVANGLSFEVSILLNNGDGKFAGKVDYNIGNQPFSIFSADVDGDGDNDLITANWFSDNVSVLLNNGNGTFAGKMDYVAGTNPFSVFSADLDGDGDNDLAVANNGSGNVSVLLNNGDGTFADKVDYDVGYGPYSVFSADVDGDGDNDLITANWFSDNVSVLLNNGNGTFADRVDYEGDGPYSVFSADLDGDGDNDLAVANNGSDNVSVLLNNGNGTFAGKMDYVAGTNPFSVFSADLDGDGDYDLAVANNGSDNVSVLLNNGNGTFADKVDYVAGTSPRSVFIADLDGDGDNDLVVANNGSDNVSVLLNLSGPYPPIVTSTDPDSGVKLGGTSVTITGSNFLSGATVTFGDSTATNVVVVSLGTITAVTPTYPAGTVDVIVTNPDGLSGTLSDGFSFVSIPGLVGDFDGNNEVGLADFVLFLDAFGTTTTSANSIFDLDGNGEVGLSDFVIFLDNFGRIE